MICNDIVYYCREECATISIKLISSIFHNLWSFYLAVVSWNGI